MSDIKCFIFDLDGTLVFNEQANFLAYRAAFGTLGLELTEADFLHHFASGGSIEDIYKEYTQTRDLAHDPQQLAKIKKLKTAEYADRFHLIEQNRATIGLLRALAPHYHTALATTSSKKNGLPLLNHFGLTNLFDCMIFGEDVTSKKPNPECHQKIAKHFGVKPQECLIFEDSPKGFAAAEAFGAHICKVIQ